MRAIHADACLVTGLIVGLAALTGFAVWRDCKRSGYTLAQYLVFRVLWLYCKVWQDYRPRGPDPLPRRGAVLLVSNHTAPADPLLLQCSTRRLISFLMAREYFGIQLLGWISQLNGNIPVNRTGRDTAAMKATLRALEQGRVIGVFPEGGINLNAHALREGKAGAAMFALMTRVPVIPVFIDRRVRTNRLVDGLLWPARARVFFGRPIDLSRYYDRRHDRGVLEEVTRLLMRSIADLSPRALRTSEL